MRSACAFLGPCSPIMELPLLSVANGTPARAPTQLRSRSGERVAWLSREAGAEEGLDFVRGARGGEELALADAAACFGEEVALRLGLDALCDHVEFKVAG